MELNKLVRDGLSEYIGFDISLIINEEFDTAIVYGGAVRDILAKQDIHDIDIMSLSETQEKIKNILLEHGYGFEEDMTKKSIMSLYKEIELIFEPFTYSKVINGKTRYIQLMKPKYSGSGDWDDVAKKINNLYYIVSQVDMSNCAVQYTHSFGLRETYIGAIKHCQHKYFIEIPKAKMRTNRIKERRRKFINRGWILLDDVIPKKNFRRLVKLQNVLGGKYGLTKYYLPVLCEPIVKKRETSNLDFF